MRYLINALPGALVGNEGLKLEIVPVKPEWIPACAVSAIGHQSTADLISKVLGRTIPMNRISTPVMKPGDVNYVALYRGPRLPEGATDLPEGAKLDFFQVTAYAARRWPCAEGDCSNCAGITGSEDPLGAVDVYECPCPHHAMKYANIHDAAYRG